MKVILSLTDFVPLFNTSTDKQHYLQLVITNVLYPLENDFPKKLIEAGWNVALRCSLQVETADECYEHSNIWEMRAQW